MDRCQVGITQCLLLLACSTAEGPNPLLQQGCTHFLSSGAAPAMAILRGESTGAGARGRDSAVSESPRRARAARLLGMEFSPITECESLNPIGQMGTIPPSQQPSWA